MLGQQVATMPNFKVNCLFVSMLLSMGAQSALAADRGVSSLGATGGLTIPSAYTLENGEVAASLGNAQDPRLGNFSKKQNYSLGFGLLPGVELFGRLADYQNPPPPNPFGWNIGGPRDISANLKWQLPLPANGWPKVAIGATDLSGGAVFFKSYYAVASDTVGPVRWSLGFARAGQGAFSPPLSGMFGGAEVRLGQTRATALLESDGMQRYAGLRYYSEALPWLGDAQVIGSVQRAFGSNLPSSNTASSWNVSLVMPMGGPDRARKASRLFASKPLPALEALALGEQTVPEQTPAAQAAAKDQMGTLARALRAMGLDRIRVGAQGDSMVVQYENHRYLHNEVDALGIVLGLAAEMAPKTMRQLWVVNLKAGQAMNETVVNITAMRRFLRSGNPVDVKGSMQVRNSSSLDDKQVAWVDDDLGAARTKVQLELAPLLNYTLGTEYGAFDYSLALKARASTTLWRGATLYADYVQRVDNSDSMESGMIYGGSRHVNGLKTVALQQSLWLGPRIFASAGVGRFNYNADDGIEGQAIYFLPWRSDSLVFSGSSMQHRADVLPKYEQAYAASYRWAWNANTTLEAGYQQYTDKSKGPALTFKRWFGDTELRIFTRTGGNNTFVGLALSIPLTPRQGMSAGTVQITGTPRFALGLRTRLTNAYNTGNWVDAKAVQGASLNYFPEVELLNAGRIAPTYLHEQLQRMREVFFSYASIKLN